mmetsp:Transcript_30522/g.57015  ORF Transcript_30522/g.57015 Transcript_30522/m.57015 type:complete len:299 (-) Transcript_30522:538-1434(-)|eukprot:CAMPEP_0170179274 /NCGR_PEP_ID=MMETSP0040_2-20121228/17224_1 /TAXON_ID=641309 /ORGANISM="Lotharella oceanica, Strain CCMP622" /LENGTH=298 /DNA_ID=CAMNT_0010423269 /DNA_START=446 /DNA_END=1342 /DNA_ORIENTATION=-
MKSRTPEKFGIIALAGTASTLVGTVLTIITRDIEWYSLTFVAILFFEIMGCGYGIYLVMKLSGTIRNHVIKTLGRKKKYQKAKPPAGGSVATPSQRDSTDTRQETNATVPSVRTASTAGYTATPSALGRLQDAHRDSEAKTVTTTTLTPTIRGSVDSRHSDLRLQVKPASSINNETPRTGDAAGDGNDDSPMAKPLKKKKEKPEPLTRSQRRRNFYADLLAKLNVLLVLGIGVVGSSIFASLIIMSILLHNGGSYENGLRVETEIIWWLNVGVNSVHLAFAVCFGPTFNTVKPWLGFE